jgi:pyruvate/2-oxoglutarate dehydrogenase complex dihydrolipoamide acyltransferase (E2) component
MPNGVKASVFKWYKQIEEGIKTGELLVELKVGEQILPVYAPQTGVVAKIYVAAGALVATHTLLALIKEGLPTLTGDTEVVIDSQYSLGSEQMNAHTQAALKELIIKGANRYAVEVQALPPKWESTDTGVGVQRNGMLEHPAFKDKSFGARQEERRHPSDIPQEH